MKELGREMAATALSEARGQCSEDRVFTLDGRKWQQLAGVVGSEFNTSTSLFTQWLPLDGVKAMLEMGSGCGVASVTAALAGCPEVLAVDINPSAVESTRLNAERYGVADRVTSLQSDLFSAVDPDARFDLAFWNSPFIDDEVARVDGDDYFIDHFFDPGYALHDRFCAELPRHLTQRGRAFLGFSSAMGDVDEVGRIAARHGLALQSFRSEGFELPHEEMGTTEVFRRAADEHGKIAIDFSLMELVR
jgi:release factor glutamine methyltransferase